MYSQWDYGEYGTDAIRNDSFGGIGLISSTFSSSLQMDRFGRKKTLLVTEIPLILGWLLISFATTVPMIYGGRLLMGLGSGMVGAPARVYTSEVTQPHLRGI